MKGMITYKIHWRRTGESLGRWATFSNKEDADRYLLILECRGYQCALVEIPAT